ncbi:7399_t:CDS:1 [Acaulospora morrowiae]|uniref:7399_t:CDS:1 n=1 Tax=Acaulospora morrowiae TaxID=94023 RepID=A0A9N9A8T4_9GLOM|nr:7399_t:CDS:1 [Acaulospora morrowiae]
MYSNEKILADVDVIAKSIDDATHSLKSACSVLRCCYDSNISKESTKLRGEATNHAMVYKEKIFPFANLVVNNIRIFCDNHQFDFDTFKDCIDDFKEEVDKKHKLVMYTTELHKKILKEFKQEEDKSKKIYNISELEVKKLEKEVEYLRSSAKISTWMNVMAIVPIVNLFVFPTIIEKSKMGVIATIKEEQLEREKATKFTIGLIRDESIKNFTTSLEKITAFFYNLSLYLSSLADEKSIRLYYNTSKATMEKISLSCLNFISNIPAIESDLDAIDYKYNENYVNRWYTEQKVRINGREMSFLEHGKILFAEDKRILEMLGTDDE